MLDSYLSAYLRHDSLMLLWIDISNGWRISAVVRWKPQGIQHDASRKTALRNTATRFWALTTRNSIYSKQSGKYKLMWDAVIQSALNFLTFTAHQMSHVGSDMKWWAFQCCESRLTRFTVTCFAWLDVGRRARWKHAHRHVKHMRWHLAWSLPSRNMQKFEFQMHRSSALFPSVKL